MGGGEGCRVIKGNSRNFEIGRKKVVEGSGGKKGGKVGHLGDNTCRKNPKIKFKTKMRVSPGAGKGLRIGSSALFVCLFFFFRKIMGISFVGCFLERM